MIESLTGKQIGAFPKYVREWTAIGLCTDSADRPRAERAVRKMYRCAGIKAPTRIVWCGSPLALVRRQPEYPCDPVDTLVSLVGMKIADRPVAKVWDCCFGQHDAGWLAYYAFMRTELGLKKQTDSLAGLTALAKCAGWALPYENTCYVSERHNVLHRDNQGRLHALDSAAVQYPDGWGVYAVRGTRVPKEWVMNRATLDPRIALTESNMDLRSAAALLIGWEKVLAQLSPKVIDSEMGMATSHGYCQGELLDIDLPGEPHQRFLRVLWGREQQAVLRVPPNMTKAREANAWTLGFEGDSLKEFKPEGRT